MLVIHQMWIAILFYQISHWSLSLQGLAVMLGCRSPTPIGPPSTSHTAVDLKSYTTKLWPEVKKVSQKSKVASLSATVWKCQGWSWECETPDRNSSLNLSHQLWCEHLLDIKHSKSFRSTSYAMHVSESAATWLNHTLTREVKRDFWQVWLLLKGVERRGEWRLKEQMTYKELFQYMQRS